MTSTVRRRWILFAVAIVSWSTVLLLIASFWVNNAEVENGTESVDSVSPSSSRKLSQKARRLMLASVSDQPGEQTARATQVRRLINETQSTISKRSQAVGLGNAMEDLLGLAARVDSVSSSAYIGHLRTSPWPESEEWTAGFADYLVGLNGSTANLAIASAAEADQIRKDNLVARLSFLALLFVVPIGVLSLAGLLRQRVPAAASAGTRSRGQLPSSRGFASASTEQLTATRAEGGQSGHPGIALESTEVADQKVLAASIIGGEHVVRGGLREDSYAFAAGPLPGSVILAVADGVGSSHQSHLASAAAARFVTARIRGLSPERAESTLTHGEEWENFATALLAALASELDPSKLELSEIDGSAHGKTPPSATVAVAVVTPVDEAILVSWIAVGDSPILALVPGDTSLQEIWNPPHSGTTEAMPQHADRGTFRIDRVPIGTVVMVMSDGMADVLLAVEDLPSRLAASHAANRGLDELVKLLTTQVHGAHDDRTIAMAAPKPARP